MKFLKSLFGGSHPKTDVRTAFDPVAPEQPFFAIGDIHGEFALMTQILDRLNADFPDTPIILVGDYIDRGERSAEVLRTLHEGSLARPEHLICLMGNHEDMCLKFLDDPENSGARWLRYGGLQTLASFGIGYPPGAPLQDVRDALADAMGPDLIAWIRGLPVLRVCGNVAVTHAGADPALPLDLQSRRNLMWGHADFETVPRADGLWIIHGHTIVDVPTEHAGRICIDTGAYATKRMSYAHVTQGGIEFRQERA